MGIKQKVWKDGNEEMECIFRLKLAELLLTPDLTLSPYWVIQQVNEEIQCDNKHIRKG